VIQQGVCKSAQNQGEHSGHEALPATHKLQIAGSGGANGTVLSACSSTDHDIQHCRHIHIDIRHLQNCVASRREK
jgi:hypothetical protein